MGNVFINWVKLLYTSPQAMVMVNGFTSPWFTLGRGTRQGCPLSPLLFSICIEPLAEAIRTHPHVSGVNSGKSEHTISLYADDILLFLSKPKQSIPAVLEVIEEFGSLSGYKVNVGKSIAFPLGSSRDLNDSITSPFNLSYSGFKYLGIHISYQLEDLVKLNLFPVLKQIKLDLSRWSSLPISWLGRIAVIKMNVLPRILYLMQMIPNSIPNSFFKDVHRTISRFIWKNKRAKIRLEKLQLPVESGGLAVPNLQYYHWSIQMKNISEWVAHDPKLIWLELDSLGCNSLSLSSLPFLDNKKLQGIRDNFIVCNILNTWNSIKKTFSTNRGYSFYAPVVDNPDFIPSCVDPGYKEWNVFGIKVINDLYEGRTLKSFNQLQAEYGLPKKHFFRFLQIRSFLNTIPQYKEGHGPEQIEELLFQVCLLRRKKTQLSLS